MNVIIYVRGKKLYPIYEGYMTRESVKSIEKDMLFMVVENDRETVTRNVSRETYSA